MYKFKYPPSKLLSLILISVFLSTFVSSQSSTCTQVTTCLQSLQSGDQCDLFPLIPGSAPPLPGPSGYTLTKISNSVYHYSDDAYHSVILYSAFNKHLAVVDFPRSVNSFPPSSPGVYLLVNAVQSIIGDFSKINQLSLIYSHRHLDHIGAANMFLSPFVNNSNTKVSVYGTLETYKFLRRLDDNQIPLPTNIISNHKITKLKINSKLIVQLFTLGGHTKSDIVTYIPINSNKKLVHFVDVITPGEAPFADFVFTTDLGRYLTVHEELLKIDFNIFSTGHGKLGTKQDVRQNLKLTQFVIKTARTAANTVNPLPILGRLNDPTDVAYRNGAWAFYEIIQLQVNQCFRKLIEEWGCTLSVVDVFGKTLCQTAAFYVLAEQ